MLSCRFIMKMNGLRWPRATINDQIDTYTLQNSEAQTVIDKNAAIAKEIKQMQANFLPLFLFASLTMK